MKRHNLAFIDLETTGLDPERHEIIEIGCIVAKQVPQSGGGAKVEKIEEFDVKVKPENIDNAEPDALRVSGYNEMEWMFAAELSQAIKQLVEKTKDCVMVGHNVSFDQGFLEKAFEKTGIENKMHYHKLDTIPIAFAKLYDNPDVQKFSLGLLCEHFGIKNERAHTALSDIRATFELYKKLLDV
tara:strand:+ start:4274 stop:4825 length:552 start_codon:yes stop_codon:yes gene_type:complete